MTITTTGIGFVFISLGLTFCGIRFFRALQRMGGAKPGWRIGILLSAFLLNFAFTVGLLGVGSLFFGEDREALYAIVLVSHFFLTTTAVLGTYVVFYIFFPLIPSWTGIILPAISGMGMITLAFLDDLRPFIDKSGVIDFNPSRGVSVLLSYMLFFSIGSAFIIFARLFLEARSSEVRIISFIMAVSAFVGIINAFIRYLLPRHTGSYFLRMGIYDAVHIITGIVFIALFVLSPLILGWFSKVTGKH